MEHRNNYLGERVVCAAGDDGLQRLRRFGVTIGFSEGAGFSQGVSGNGLRKGGITFNGPSERGAALLLGRITEIPPGSLTL